MAKRVRCARMRLGRLSVLVCVGVCEFIQSYRPLEFGRNFVDAGFDRVGGLAVVG